MPNPSGIQFSPVNTGISTVASATFTTASLAGDFLWAVVTASSSTTVTAPTNWTKAVANSVASYGITILYYPNAGSISSLSVTLPSSLHWAMMLGEINHTATSSPYLDQTNTADTGSGSSGSITTTATPEYILVCLSSASWGGTQQSTIGWTTEGSSGTTGSFAMKVVDYIATSTGTYSNSDSNYADGAIVSFFGGNSTGTTGGRLNLEYLVLSFL